MPLGGAWAVVAAPLPALIPPRAPPHSLLQGGPAAYDRGGVLGVLRDPFIRALQVGWRMRVLLMGQGAELNC